MVSLFTIADSSVGKQMLNITQYGWSIARQTPHKTNRSADLRRDPSLAILPVMPMRGFKARPLPAMYGVGIGRGGQVKVDDEGERPKIRQ